MLIDILIKHTIMPSITKKFVRCKSKIEKSLKTLRKEKPEDVDRTSVYQLELIYTVWITFWMNRMLNNEFENPSEVATKVTFSENLDNIHIKVNFDNEKYLKFISEKVRNLPIDYMLAIPPYW